MDVKCQNHKQQNSTTERSLKVTKLGAHAMVMSAADKSISSDTLLSLCWQSQQPYGF